MKRTLRALFLVLAFLLPLTGLVGQEPSSNDGVRMGELYLAYPFCVDQAMAKGLKLRILELNVAVEAERSSGACLARLKSFRPDLGSSGEDDLAQMEGYLEFALAFSFDPGSLDFKRLAARRIACDASALFFKAAGLQKALEDSKGIASASDSIKNLDAFFAARTDLLENIAYTPPAPVKFDTVTLDEIAAAPRATLERLESLDLTVSDGEGGEASFKLPEFLKTQAVPAGVSASALGFKRVWMLIGRKAALTLLEPKSTKAERMLAQILARLSVAALSRARACDAKDLLARLDEELKKESMNPPGPVLADLIARRSRALAECCRAIEAASDPDGSKALHQHEVAEPEGPVAQPGPPDPLLIETQDPLPSAQ